MSPPRLERRLPESRVDWLIGIALGIALGIAVIVAFLYFGSEGTIDAPRISGVDSGKPAQLSRPQAPARGGEFSSPEGTSP